MMDTFIVCRMQHRWILTFAILNLEPTAAPKFTREPSDMALDIGSNVTLGCLVQGYPDPRVTWRREDGLLLFNRPRTHGSVAQSRGGLHITCKLNFPCKYLHWKGNWLWFMPNVLFFLYSFSDLWVEDDAVYICEAQNRFGKIEAKARITVTGLGRCKRSSSISVFF